MRIEALKAPQEISPLIYRRVFAWHFTAGKIHPSHYLIFNSMKTNESNADFAITRGASREFMIPYLSSA